MKAPFEIDWAKREDLPACPHPMALEPEPFQPERR
jgi:hypothetical protein